MGIPRLFPVFRCALGICSLLFVSNATAQITGGIELQFAGQDSIHAEAGAAICFRLVAKDSAGNVITDWFTTGGSATISILHSTAQTDTSFRSWSSASDGYSWDRLSVDGKDLPRISPHAFLLAREHFVNGIAEACYTSSKSESGVRLRVTPQFGSLETLSPPIDRYPASMNNYLVDLTAQDSADITRYYMRRKFEVTVAPRDRFLNIITTGVPTEIIIWPTASITWEEDGGMSNRRTLFGSASFYMVPGMEAPQSGSGERIEAREDKWRPLTGESDTYFVLPHEPVPFKLLAPRDWSYLDLDNAEDTVRFQWERPSPPDPYTNMRVSKSSPERASDTVRYQVHFRSYPYMAREHIRDSDSSSLAATCSMSQEELLRIAEYVTGFSDSSECQMVWFVTASDGLYSNISTADDEGYLGNRITITNTVGSGNSVSFDYASEDTIQLVAGEAVNFVMVALDSAHQVIANWDSIGTAVKFLVESSTVNSDTSVYSWNDDPEAKSWSKLTVAGKQIGASVTYVYTIPHTLFQNGRAQASYRSSKAEKNVRLRIVPTYRGVRQSLPPVTWRPAEVQNYLLEVTWPDPWDHYVFLRRPYEVVAIARDRFLNPVEKETPVRLGFRFKDENIAYPGSSPDALDTGLVINSMQGLFLLPTVSRERAVPREQQQMITAQHPSDPTIHGQSESFYVLDHAPGPFSLLTPVDATELLLDDPGAAIIFTWEAPFPPDRYYNISISRFAEWRLSDTVHYQVRFLDEATLTKTVRYPSDAEGTLTTLTADQSQLLQIMDALANNSISKLEAVWCVEASDGVFVTVSDSSGTLPGRRLTLSRTTTDGTSIPVLPSDPRLEQNYPNPFNPATTIRFSIPRRSTVVLRVFNLVGEEVSTIQRGELDAGEHALSFRAEGLPSGVYVYRLESDGISLSRTMVVLK
ncbi:MAG: T9SS type A sorting domain-containing protein [Bacteroidetes bacterium]|nr:T9SS type A sorting domain-containing protein [Bacteroidota bacterium]